MHTLFFSREHSLLFSQSLSCARVLTRDRHFLFLSFSLTHTHEHFLSRARIHTRSCTHPLSRACIHTHIRWFWDVAVHCLGYYLSLSFCVSLHAHTHTRTHIISLAFSRAFAHITAGGIGTSQYTAPEVLRSERYCTKVCDTLVHDCGCVHTHTCTQTYTYAYTQISNSMYTHAHTCKHTSTYFLWPVLCWRCTLDKYLRVSLVTHLNARVLSLSCLVPNIRMSYVAHECIMSAYSLLNRHLLMVYIYTYIYIFIYNIYIYIYNYIYDHFHIWYVY